MNRNIEIVYEYSSPVKPKLSIILLDWSVRESFHSLDYLNRQTVSRESYEIIWIEYYQKKPKELREMIEQHLSSDEIPSFNQWVVMNISEQYCYHKHLMYNIGILLSRGEIVCFSDSDAVYSPTFVDSILRTFKEQEDIILHLDEARSVDKKFYPFNYPTIEEIIQSPCLNVANGKPIGLIDLSDPLHMRNYGACLIAKREDLVEIGGADEHVDYLGHVCGPYEMTFRLLNNSKQEVWHPKECLYHTWHPGQAGYGDYVGPHDGLRISTIALATRSTKRILPLIENPLIRKLRQGKRDIQRDAILTNVISEQRLSAWEKDKVFPKPIWFWNRCLRKINLLKLVETDALTKSRFPLSFLSYGAILLWMNCRLYIFLFRLLYDQFRIRMHIRRMININNDQRVQKQRVSHAPSFFNRLLSLGRFAVALVNYDVRLIARCWGCLNKLRALSRNRTILYGSGRLSEIICFLAKWREISMIACYDDSVVAKNKKAHPLESLKWDGQCIIIASTVDVEEMKGKLMNRGVSEANIITL